jgi:hypothetical protein
LGGELLTKLGQIAGKTILASRFLGQFGLL